MACHVSINKNGCIGCGNCATLFPKIFRIRKGKAEVIKEKIKRQEEVLAAESSCPVQAIKISKGI